jgi:glutaredoxin
MDLDKGTNRDLSEFESSSFKKVTVYSKSGCNDCEKVKMYLEDLVENGQLDCNDIAVINCDVQLLTNREQFVSEMMKMTGKTMVVFPLVFVNGQFIGGFKSTLSTFDPNVNKVEQNNLFNLDSAF